METSKRSTLVTGFVASLVIFGVAIVLPKLLFEDALVSRSTTQGLEVVLSLVAIALLGKGKFGEYGFRLPRSGYFTGDKSGRLVWVAAGAVAVGVIATLAISFGGGTGNPAVKQLSLPQIVLFIWILSSVVEEIFVRGFFQSHLSRSFNGEIRLGFIRVGIPTLIGALFFSAMHLVILMAGADTVSVVVILGFTFCLGLIAGNELEKSGSLLPAIVLHLLGNIGGVVGGIIYAVIKVLSK